MEPILLASRSPRRVALLRMLGLTVETVAPSVDESAVTAETPAALAGELSRLKATEVFERIKPAFSPVVAADTLVDLDGAILGKPRDEDAARAMLRALSGRKHFVHTGVTVIGNGRAVTAVESAAVFFRDLTDGEIDAYVMTGEPMDKAGAYGIQGFAGAFAERIEGDYYTVVGLPLSRLITVLRDMGYAPLSSQ